MKILLFAYGCDPFGRSESLAAFSWLNILIKYYQVILITTTANEENIRAYYKDIPSNIEIIGIEEKFNFRKYFLLRAIIYGYFVFSYKAFRLVKNREIDKQIDIIFHKSPSSFRFFNFLFKINKPFIFGPTGGGLQIPKVLNNYFKKEPFIFRLRFLDKLIFRIPIYKNQFKKSYKILITLPYVRNVLPNYIEQNKIVELFDTGINTNEFTKEKAKKNDKVVFLYVGIMRRYKGPELAIKAFLSMEPEKREISQLHMVGDGEELNYLKALVPLNESKRILFHGNVNFNMIKEFYNVADVFIFPSIKEASGNSLLEAMSFSLPIITVNNGGPKYMCPNNGSIKIEINTPEIMIENFKKSMEDLVNDQEKRIKMGEINRQHCIEKYDWIIIEKNIKDFFDSIKNEIKS
ncbi:MAG: glycosyltransferase family 4 protein [Salinivirgaceae bacterium]